MKLIVVSLSIILSVMNINSAMARDNHRHYKSHHYQRNYYNPHYSSQNHYNRNHDYYQRSHNNRRHYYNNHHYNNYASLLVSGLIGGIAGALITQSTTHRPIASRYRDRGYYNPYQ